MSAPSIGVTSARAALDGETRFFVRAAAVCVVVAFAGFVSRYFAPMAAGTFAARTLVHLHGLAMWMWMLLFAGQSWLAATGRLRRHRASGMAGIALFTLAVWLGLSVALLQLDRQIEAGDADRARAFVALPLSLSITMVALFVAALANAKRPEAHARLMLLVTLVALTPALARLVGDVSGTGAHPRNPVIAAVIVLIAIGLAATRDLHVRGRVHAAYLYGGVFVAIMTLARFTLNRTDAWSGVADALRTLVH
ncbi:MAG TPA: hypothetical protein VD737_02135 [Steroidobacteraceae bacterium]|nr:hypothetical protein [Steroidobacteraceae bacterium]